MDFSLTDEQLTLLQRLDSFCDEHLVERDIQRWLDEGGVPDSFALSYYQEGFADLGTSERLGGKPVDELTRVLILERLALRAGATLPMQEAMLDSYIISRVATDEQVDTLADQVSLTGRLGFSLAVTEPASGSDSLNALTQAVETDDGFIINGAKSFVSNGQYASYIAVLAHDTALGDANDQGHRPLTLFLVSREAEGVDAIPILKAGQKLIPTAEILFNDVFVPRAAVMGTRGEAAPVILRAFSVGRLYLCATTVGLAQAAYQQAMTYGLGRSVSGNNVLDFQQIQELVTDMQIKIDTMRCMLYKTACAFDAHEGDLKLQAALLKRYVPTAAMEVADSAMQIMGSMGYLDSTKCARIWKECRGNRISEGTDQIMNIIAGKRLVQRAKQNQANPSVWQF